MLIPSAAIDTRGSRHAILISTLLFSCAILFVGAGAHAQADDDGQPTPAPAPVPSPTLSNDGIFGCRGQGANISNVGTLSAIGGVYVPVNDAAVTLNTGYLVYKECVLDAVARKIAENVTAEQTSQVYRAVATGRNGNAQFRRNSWVELLPQKDAIFVQTVTGAEGVMCPAFKGTVRRTVARAYVATRHTSYRQVTCSMPGQNASLWERLAALREEQNNAYGASLALQGLNARLQAANEFDQRERWVINRGFYDTMDDPNDPLGGNIVTPGYIIAASLEQMTGSGFRQNENATEIDQVVGNLWGGLTTQLVADTRGLIGLTQSVNGQPSYIDRMTAQTSASVRQQAANAALAVIGAARQIEVSYRQAKEGTATALSNAIEKLRAAENQCWNLIVPAVQAHAQTNGNPPLNIATSSTQFSQTVIDANIAPLATTTVRDIRNSDAALALLNQLIASVSNSASQANQQQALLRLDTMVANRQLHTTTDANNAIQQRDAVATALTKLVEDTIKAWGDDTDPNIGWCNVNNPAVVERWFNEWRQ